MTRRLVARTIVAGSLLGALVGCTEEETTREARFELVRLGSCDDVRERVRAQAIADMEARLTARLQDALESTCDDGYYDYDQSPAPTSGGDDAGGGGGGGGGPLESSGTNNQVAGVDEADLVKNQDGYLYIVNAGKLRIIDAWPPEQAHVVSEVPIEGEVRKLFLHAGRALVYSSLGAPVYGDGDYGGYGRGECTYGYSCSFTGDGRSTKVTVVDVSAVGNPQVIREIKLSGSLIAARRIGAGVHTVVADHAPSVADLEYWPEEINYCSSALDKIWAFDRLRKRNTARIEQSPIDLFVPTATDSAGGELGGRCDQFYGAEVGDGAAFTSVLSLDITGPGNASFTSIVSRPGAVAGSPDALYMAVPRALTDGSSETTAIHKFAVTSTPLGAEYRGSGLVKGHVLNQFAMDEHAGALRVATTTGHAFDPNAHSTVTVLREQNGGLEQVGVVDDLAPGEDIRSVRFAGDRGFVVTFKKTDPLYVFDLAVPEAPRVLSELKIPGFSTYMHMLDDTHLLSIGYDADDQGSFAWFTGMLLQIFDVTNPAAPVLAHRHVIGTRGSSSEALTNHLAFTYFAPRQALALPMTICEGGVPPSYGQMTFSGLLVYRATADAGFAELGRVTHPASDGISCSNWWSDASSQVRRSVFMDDYVFSISGSSVKANALGNLATDLVTIPIAN
jgi:Beta propeller domain